MQYKSLSRRLPANMYSYRLNHQYRLSQSRRQLITALAAQDEVRIRKAKLTFIRWLLAIAESPELGPIKPFSWGYRLKALILAGADPQLTWSECEKHTTYFSAARYLRESIHEQ